MQLDPAVVIAALGGIGVFLSWLIKAVIADAWKQRDEANSRGDRQTIATEKLAITVDRQGDLIEKLIRQLGGAT